MEGGFRKSMAWLHTWTGLLVGWLLFFIFLTGTLGYFDSEIDRWMRPELPLVHTDVAQGEAIALGMRRLEEVAPDATQWTIYPPSGRDILNINLSWTEPGSIRGSEVLDNGTGRPVEARDTGGGQALYQLHYVLRYVPSTAAYWIVGFCSMLMLTAIVTGVITHKRIFRDFFTFRPRRGQRSWLDIHNVLGVLALPFHLMITYSGLVFFVFTYMAVVVSATYGSGADDRSRFFDEAFRNPALPAPAGVDADSAPLAPMLAELSARWGEGQIRSLQVHHPGDANARVVVTRNHVTPVSNGGRIVFDGVSGAVLEHTDRRTGPMVVNDALLGLHEGLFASPVLRWLYFFSGLLGTGLIATGLVLWTAKRRSSPAGQRHAGLVLVERLNVGTLIGLPIGIAAYFWANRLIPVDVAERAAREMDTLFIVWLAMLLYAAARPLRRAWLEQSVMAALAFGLLPVLNAATSDYGLARTLPAREWMLAGFDLTVVVCALGFGVIAWYVLQPSAGERAAKTAKMTATENLKRRALPREAPAESR